MTLLKGLLVLSLTGLVWIVAVFFYDANQTVIDLGRTNAGLNELVGHAHKALDKDQAYEDRLLEELPKTTVAIRRLVDSTNKRLNEPVTGLLPHVSENLDLLTSDAEATLGKTTQDVDQVSASIEVTSEAVGKTADAATRQLDDPQLVELLGHLNVSALHLENIAGNADAMSSDMRLAVHRLAQPPSKFKTFLDVSYTGLKFGSLFIP